MYANDCLYTLQVHSGKKDFACDFCPMKFVRIQGLRRHRLTHTGEKPLICKYCGAGFAAHMTLSMHERLHTGERPYVCKHCGKGFIGQPALNVSVSGRRVTRRIFIYRLQFFPVSPQATTRRRWRVRATVPLVRGTVQDG